MSRSSFDQALRALRALYVIVREPHRDAIAEAVASFGRRLRTAVAAHDHAAARAVLDDVAEWLLRMRHVVSTRLEWNFATTVPSLPIGRASVRAMSFKPRSRRDRSDPFALLLNSHARLRERLALLADAASELTTDGARDEALLEVVEVSQFIDRAVARHERDEEESLFPRLRQSGLAPALAPTIDALTAEHRQHERLHDELRTIAATCNERPLNAQEAHRLTALTAELTATYGRHIELEEAHIFPEAQRVLPADVLTAIAAEMQARRGR